MFHRSVVLYRGPDAQRAADAWNAGDRQFTVDGVPYTEPPSALADRDRLDCVVCIVDDEHGGGSFLAAVRERSDELPLVMLNAGETETLAEAVAYDPTFHFDVGPDVDPVDALETLAPTIKRAIKHRRERSMFDSLLENIPLPVYFEDCKRRHVRVSDNMLSMIGPDYIENPEGKRHHHPDDMIGKSDYDVYPNSLAEETTADDQTVIQTEEPIEDRVEHSYGEPGTGTYVATSKAPWYDDDGNVIGLLGVTRDISERKGYEYHLEKQNERLERFATMVSHDVRNPLSVAVGRLQAAQETGEDEHFEAIERSLERIESIIEDVLLVTRQAESVLDPAPVVIADFAASAWEVVETGDAVLEVTIDARILADPGRLRQLFENLFANAIAHGTGDGVDVADLTVTVGELPAGEGFYVEDDGTGIPPAKRDTIFEAGISEADGTGLGLSIVTSIANAHNWRIELTESDAGGARFEFHGVRRPSGGS
jgi:PAS domain S-box-containing protein